jgi:protein-S-isoprenylcysteine O-methyltransferase Ste14
VAAVVPSGPESLQSASERRFDPEWTVDSRSAPGELAARVGVLLYGVVCYAVFLATFLYAIGWLSGIGGLTPTALDAAPKPGDGTRLFAVAINLLLLGLFAVQHSVMARPWFKRVWTRIVPPAAERSTYVLFSCVALVAMFWLWRPMGGVVWDVQNPAARGAIHAACASGWLLVLAATFLLNHFDLFGLRQVWLRFLGREYTALPFRAPVLYRVVRHPLYVGWLVAFWAAPTMTAAHLLFAVVTTVYILMAIQWEERDLVATLPEYAQYRRRVGMLLPRWSRSGSCRRNANPRQGGRRCAVER